MPKAVVVAYVQSINVKLLLEYGAHEVVGGELREFLGEGHYGTAVHSGAFYLLTLLVEGA